MILEFIIEAVSGLLMVVLDLLPDLPALPQSFTTAIDNVFDIIFGHLDLLNLFVRVGTIQVLVPLVIIVINFEHIYHIVLWVIHKLPLSID